MKTSKKIKLHRQALAILELKAVAENKAKELSRLSKTSMSAHIFTEMKREYCHDAEISSMAADRLELRYKKIMKKIKKTL